MIINSSCNEIQATTIQNALLCSNTVDASNTLQPRSNSLIKNGIDHFVLGNILSFLPCYTLGKFATVCSLFYKALENTEYRTFNIQAQQAAARIHEYALDEIKSTFQKMYAEIRDYPEQIENRNIFDSRTFEIRLPLLKLNNPVNRSSIVENSSLLLNGSISEVDVTNMFELCVTFSYKPTPALRICDHMVMTSLQTYNYAMNCFLRISGPLFSSTHKAICHSALVLRNKFDKSLNSVFKVESIIFNNHTTNHARQLVRDQRYSSYTTFTTKENANFITLCLKYVRDFQKPEKSKSVVKLDTHLLREVTIKQEQVFDEAFENLLIKNIYDKRNILLQTDMLKQRLMSYLERYTMSDQPCEDINTQKAITTLTSHLQRVTELNELLQNPIIDSSTIWEILNTIAKLERRAKNAYVTLDTFFESVTDE